MKKTAGFILLSALTLLTMAARPVAAQTFGYVTNRNSNNVSVIDIASDSVVATVTVGSGPWGVAMAPNGAFVYVTNISSNSVSVIATASDSVVATVGVGSQPTGVAITPDGARAYVANNSTNTVSVIATATNSVVATVPVGVSPREIAITPDGAFAYVTNISSNTVSVIATATDSVVATVPVGTSPWGIAMTPDGAFAYVANFGANSVSVIATASNTVVATVPVGSFPYGVAITPNGSFAYVTNQNSNSVSVIATATDSVVATVTVGNTPQGVAITPDGAFTYVTNFISNSVSVIATSTNGVVTTVAVGTSPKDIAIGTLLPKVGFTLASSSGDESISPVDFAVSLSAVSEFDVTVDYAVTGGTAIGGGVDYTLAAGTATIPAGQTTTNITAIVVDDIMTEPDETIIVTLSNPINATLGTNTTHTYTILDNDPLVEWELQITAADNSLEIIDSENFAGVSSAATDTFDAGFDVPEPPHAPSQYISLYFTHPEWNHLLGDNFSQDIRANADLSDANIVWDIAVDNDMSHLFGNILTLDIIPQGVPPGLNIVLRDLETGTPPSTQDMRAEPVYSYTANFINLHDHFATDSTALASGSVHHFQLAVGDSTPPFVAVTAPNGGEILAFDSTYTITWDASDGSGIDWFGLRYSTDAGSTFTDIDIVPGDRRSYLWSVPDTLTDQALIAIRARDNMGNFGFDQSDSPFTITDTTPPSVQVKAPNGGEILTGSTYTITWTASDNFGLASFELFYSSDAGSIYTFIDTVGGDLRSYLWNVPLVTTERALIKVRAIDIVGNFAADVSDGLFTIISRTQSHTYNAGWNLISVPLIPDNAFADAVIGDDVPPASYYFLFGYQAGTGYVLSDSVFLSEGYWLATVDTVNVDVQGTPVAQTQTVPLAGGWNLIGNPFVGSVLKSAAEVQLGATTLGFQAAVDTGWISPVLYTYAAENAGYSQKDTLDPWSGYWFGTLVEGLNLLINPIGPPLVETTKPAETTKPLAKQVVSSADWQVIVAARSDGVADLISAFGVNESATNGFDAAFDEPEPPLPPAGDVIRLYFPHPEWGVILGDKFNLDIQAPLGDNETLRWTFEVQRVGSVEPVELSWDAITVENHIFALTDLDAQETIDMTEQTSYSYTGDDLIRHFQIEVTNTTVVSVGDGEETLPTTYDLSQNYPNPFNPATTIRFDLPEAAAVRLVVYDLQGREVATLVTGDRRAGYHSVVWDGKAAIGGEAPSGIYIARLVTPGFAKSIKMVLLK